MNNIQLELTAYKIRKHAIDGVYSAKSGHPGLPMGCAPIAYTLFQNFLKFNPDDLTWDNRDRFVLSAGHGSMLLYSLFYLYNNKSIFMTRRKVILPYLSATTEGIISKDSIEAYFGNISQGELIIGNGENGH